MTKSLIGVVLILFANMSFANIIVWDKTTSQVLDTVPVTLDARAKKIDSNVFIVLDGKALGTIRDIKYLDSIINPDNIKSIYILKDSVAASKYGEKGKSGVIEIFTKDEVRPQLKDLYLEEVKNDDNIVFEKAEIEPSFPGGAKEWKNFIVENLNPNVPVMNGCKPGTYIVVVQFIVGKDGTVKDLRALTNHGFGMEEEVMRVIKKGPKWVPGMQNGVAVNAYRKQPFTFIIAID